MKQAHSLIVLTAFVLCIASLAACHQVSTKKDDKSKVVSQQITPNQGLITDTIGLPKLQGVVYITPGKWGSDPFVKDGEYTERYPNGQRKEQGVYHKGKRDGPWFAWYSNGQPWSEGNFDEGVRNGPAKTWFENGKIRYTGQFKNDVRTGSWAYYDETGKLVQTEDCSKATTAKK